MVQSKKLLFGIGFTVTFLAFFLIRADVEKIWQALSDVKYFYVLPALLCYVGALVWRTFRWKTILRPLGVFKFSILWRGLIVGYSANNLLPVRLGDIVRSYYISHFLVSSKTSVFATIVLERVFDGLGLLFLMGLVTIFLPTLDFLDALGQKTQVNSLTLSLLLSIPFVTAIGLLGLVTTFPNVTRRSLIKAISIFPSHIEVNLTRFFELFLEGLSSLRHPSRVLTIFILTLLVWVSESGVFLLLAFGFDLNLIFYEFSMLFGVLILTTAIANLATSIPSAAGGIGPFEFFAQTSLIFFGLDISLASAYILTVHALLLFPVTILGLVYIWLGKGLLEELPWLGSRREVSKQNSRLATAKEKADL